MISVLLVRVLFRLFRRIFGEFRENSRNKSRTRESNLIFEFYAKFWVFQKVFSLPEVFSPAFRKSFSLLGKQRKFAEKSRNQVPTSKTNIFSNSAQNFECLTKFCVRRLDSVTFWRRGSERENSLKRAEIHPDEQNLSHFRIIRKIWYILAIFCGWISQSHSSDKLNINRSKNRCCRTRKGSDDRKPLSPSNSPSSKP